MIQGKFSLVYIYFRLIRFKRKIASLNSLRKKLFNIYAGGVLLCMCVYVYCTYLCVHACVCVNWQSLNLKPHLLRLDTW